MKYLKTFESVKEKYNIEDFLLEFEDSAEISNVKIFIELNIMITFDISEDLIGLDKLKVLDKIILRLKRKYPFIYIRNNILCIDLIKKDMHYITWNVSEVFENILREKLTGLKVYNSISTSHSKYKFFGFSTNELIFSYIPYRLNMYSDIINLFKGKYMLHDKSISDIIAKKVTELYGLKIDYVAKAAQRYSLP